jgi:hypothetical protein
MNSFDMVKKAVSNTERSQYKHSEVKQRARYKRPQDRTAERVSEKGNAGWRARVEPIAAPHASNR